MIEGCKSEHVHDITIYIENKTVREKESYINPVGCVSINVLAMQTWTECYNTLYIKA